jgi:hypothetical protein
MSENDAVVKPWQTDDPNVFCIAGVKIAIVKKGRVQAKQIAELNRWMKENLAPITKGLVGKDQTEVSTGWEIFGAMADQMTEDALMTLASVLVGDKDANGQPLPANFLDDNWDKEWVQDALTIAGKKSSVQGLLSAFFTSIG